MTVCRTAGPPGGHDNLNVLHGPEDSDCTQQCTESIRIEAGPKSIVILPALYPEKVVPLPVIFVDLLGVTVFPFLAERLQGLDGLKKLVPLIRPDFNADLDANQLTTPG
jgi:hypothetical protein